jgi:hypothetical protein
MILLAATTDKLQLVTSAAVTIDVHCSYIDASSTTLVPSGGGKQNTAITTATTTDILAAPGASTLRNLKAMTVRNKHATSSCDVTVVFDQNATDFELYKCTLVPGATLEFIEGVGFFVTATALPSAYNASTANQTGFAADTYLVGSNITIPPTLKIGSRYRLTFDMVKTAAGTAASTLIIRYGTAGSTADTARVTFTFGAGTAAVDTGTYEVFCHFRSVGSGTSAVLQGMIECSHHLAATGLISTGASGNGILLVTSGGFDSTPAGSIIGASFNGGASFSGTNTKVEAELLNAA